jgi:ubiquinone/menaquinone biosynthesis C-methylase UbiE
MKEKLMTTDVKTMKENVKERYGELARQVIKPEEATPVKISDGYSLLADSCCGPDCCEPGNGVEGSGVAQTHYQNADIADLPDSVTDISLGCGDPTAIANLKPGEVVLDLGSGGGIDCFLAARAVGPNGRVIGVDMTDNMLELANKNKAKLSVDNVEFRKGEIEDLPVADNSIDVIISNCVINLSPDKDAVFAEAFRVLKPGARFAVSDMVTEGEYPEQLKQNVNAWAGCISGALDQNIYLEKLRQAGFVEVGVESRKSYGLENLADLDEDSRQALTKDVDWSTVPDNLRLYSARIVARKPDIR